ncbi:TetR/AcrR family transcriptional regulator [Actinocorallia sp. B10E7]|uniref:TetR/AcrR family transcriptional regulator n=1 Tax=Actinocorallia sp. B10E7 TaxID=3153558 RepID=UPI00325DE9B8
MSTPRRLPRGRNALPLEEVARLQRERLCRAMAEAMAEEGYAGTSVEDVLKRARVSRLSFYRLFDSKLDCFTASLDRANELLLGWITDAIGTSGTGGDPVERYERALGAYFDMIEAEWAYARLCMVEVYAAGPGAVSHRSGIHEAMVALHAEVLGVTDEQGLLACHMLVAATVALTTPLAAENDREGLRSVGPQLVAYVRSLWNAGVFGAGTGPVSQRV